MEEIKLNKNNFVTVLQKSLEVLRRGGVIVFPTETSYGLGADYYNPQAVRRVYKIKEREAGKPLSVLVPDLVSALALTKFTAQARALALAHWPGPLTLVLPFLHRRWQKHFHSSLALRVSSHAFAHSLTINLGRPLVATSANVSGQGDCYSAAQVRTQWRGRLAQPDLFINAGTLPRRRPSTIVKCDERGAQILRQGELKVKI